MYISPADILGITPNELMTLDKQGIIRLEKRLKAQRLQGEDVSFNPQQFDELIEQLSDEDKKKSIYFVEMHPDLKKFISSGKDNGVKTFSIDTTLLHQTPHIAEFLEPYFNAYFMRLVKQDYNNKKYDTILKAMENKQLFTDRLLTTYDQYISDQVQIVIEIIKVAKKGQLIGKCPQITYKTFVQLLNTVSLGSIRSIKLDYVNTMVDYYNATKNGYAEFSKIKRVFANFRFIEIGDQELHDYMKKLADQIGSVAAVNRNKTESSSSSSSSGYSVIGIVIVAIIFIFRIGRIFNSSSSSNYDYSNSSAFTPPTIETTYYDDKTAFYSDLIHKASGDTIRIKKVIVAKSGSSPYPFAFKKMEQPANADDMIVPVVNNRKNPFIIFSNHKIFKRSKAMFFEEGSTFHFTNELQFNSLIFYMGNTFVGQNKTFKNYYRNDRLVLRPEKRYFKNVSEKELEILKNRYVIDSIGLNPKIIVDEETISFQNIFYHIENQKILEPEPEEIEEEEVVIETLVEPDHSSGLAWKNEKNTFFRKLVKPDKEGAKKSDYLVLNLRNKENPYSELFKNTDHSSINGYEVKVYNDSPAEEVILFARNLPQERDQSAYIAPSNSISIYLHDQNDTLFFYKGNNFSSYIEGFKTQTENQNRARFRTVTKENLSLLKMAYVVDSLGPDPEIKLKNAELIFNDIFYHIVKTE